VCSAARITTGWNATMIKPEVSLQKWERDISFDGFYWIEAEQDCDNGDDDDRDGMIDCLDPDCAGGSNRASKKCCFVEEDCEEGSYCSEEGYCAETNCREGSGDEDSDGLWDCADDDCNGMVCGENKLCMFGSCTIPPDAPEAPEEQRLVGIEIFSYDDILLMINKCKVREGEGTTCREICAEGEIGFGTKWEDEIITRCTCC